MNMMNLIQKQTLKTEDFVNFDSITFIVQKSSLI